MSVFLKKLRRSFLIDPSAFITIAACVVLGLLAMVGGENLLPKGAITGITLVALGSISFSLLNLLRAVRDSGPHGGGIQHTLVVQGFPKHFQEDLEDSKELTVIGVSLSGIIENYSDVFRQKLASKKRLNFLVVDPDSQACDLITSRDQTLGPEVVQIGVDYQRGRIRSTLRILEEWKEKYPKHIDVRLASYPMDFEIVLADVGARRVIYMRHYPFRNPLGGELHIVISNRDEQRFQYYEKHIANLWKSGVDPIVRKAAQHGKASN
ncbi:MAG: hypothetical protein GC190_03105 [Alphaproteobacteria bacterium]|nr:hypothetical protein [Alphaproteobacteria bacterium]